MKLVIDTNILISGSLWFGPPAELLTSALAGKAGLFLSPPILRELRDVLQRPKFAARLAAVDETPESLTERFRSACHEVLPASIAPLPDLRDPDDLHVLACAIAAEADAIVTGNLDLLTLGSYAGIPIIRVSQALALLETR